MTMINCLTCAPEGYEHDEADCGVDSVGGDHLPVDPGQVGAVLRHSLGRHAVLGPLVVAALIQSGAGGVPVLDTHWHLHLDSNYSFMCACTARWQLYIVISDPWSQL